MAAQRPLVLIGGNVQQLPVGDTVEGSAGSGGGAAIVYYLDETLITAGNYTLSAFPTTLPETTRTAVCNSTVNGGVTYLNRYQTLPLGGTSIEGGEWVFHTYAACTTPSGINEIVTRINKVVQQTGITVTFTGSGPTRTVTATGGTPFVPGDATSSVLTATLIRTPNQTAWITGYTSSSVVTVTLTDPAYINESGVTLTSMYYLLFSVTTGDITSATVSMFETRVVQPSHGINTTDSIVAAYFGRTDSSSNRTITLYYNGEEHYTHIETPLRTRHNDLGGLNEGDIKHLTAAEKVVIGNTSGTNTGDNTIATGLKTATTSVIVSAATAPSNGQVLTATSGTAASWQTPAGGSLSNWTESVHTASPNDTVPAVRFLATNAATAVDAVISPKGAGAIIAQVPDSTSAGGNKRGGSAVDLQTSRSLASHVASGTWSAVGGGSSNTASGWLTTVAGGYANTASGMYASVTGGYNNNAATTASSISGGSGNTLSGGAGYSTIGGGSSNSVTATNSLYCTISGGTNNTAGDGYSCTVGGGSYNTATGASSITIAGGSSNTATGGNATIGGGTGNSAAGDSSCVPGGNSNVASGHYSFAYGYLATAQGVRGRSVFGYGSATAGRYQKSTFGLRTETTDATPVILSSDGAYTQSASNQLVLPNASAFAFSGMIVVRRENFMGQESAAFKVEGFIQRDSNAASTTLVASSVTAISNVPGWAVSLAADTTLGALRISVTGGTNRNLRWSAAIETVEVISA